MAAPAMEGRRGVVDLSAETARRSYASDCSLGQATISVLQWPALDEIGHRSPSIANTHSLRAPRRESAEDRDRAVVIHALPAWEMIPRSRCPTHQLEWILVDAP